MITTNTKKILLADDSVFFRTKMRDVLVDAGHLVTLVEDGQKVVEKITEEGAEAFDLMILDLEMPELDGFGVVEWMSENDHIGRFPILIATGVYKESEAMTRLKGHGVNRFITKEAPPEEIVFIVNKILFPTETFERVDDRTPIEIATTFTLDGELKGGVILNMSVSGLFLKTTAKLPEGMIIEFDFSLPDVEKKVEIVGVVKRVTKESAKDNRFGGVGIQFTKLSPMDKRAVEVFVASRLKDIRRPKASDRKY